MDIKIISDNLKSDIIGRKIMYKEETDSTNNDAKRCMDYPDGSTFIAERQTAGKGRRGRIWEAEKGSEILMTVLLKPPLPPEKISAVTAIVGIAVCRAVRKSGINAEIKWPNDIICRGKKLCGILCEMSVTGIELNYVAAGIGINANTESFLGELSDKATSLRIEKGEPVNREKLTAEVLSEFDKCYAKFLKNGFSAFKEKYEKLCATIGKEVKVVGKETYCANAVGINEDGELLIEFEGKISALNSGEVSVRGIYGYV